VLATLSRWRPWVQIPSGALNVFLKVGTIRKPAKRPSSNLGDLWVRLPLVPLYDLNEGWCSSRRPVKPLPSNCEAVGERFNSFTTHFPSGLVVYWSGHHPLKVEKGVRLPSRLIPLRVVGRQTVSVELYSLTTIPRRDRCPTGSHKADYPVRYWGLGHCGRAGARPSFISSEAVVRLPGPQIGVR
jgi:hypothetical protein